MTDLKDKWTGKTLGGHEFRIYADDHGGGFPIVGAVLLDGVWFGERWTREGRTSISRISPCDLIPRPQTVWINVYPDGAASHHASRALAEKAAAITVADEWQLLACIEVPKTWEN